MSSSLDITKLKAADNDEWTKLIELHKRRLRSRTKLFMDHPSWEDDAVSNILAAVFALRMTFKDTEHLINYMYWSVKHQCFELLFYGQREVLSDDLAVKLERYLSRHAYEVETLEERAKQEAHKDELVEIIKSKAARMPAKLREFLLVWLGSGRKDVAAKLNALKLKYKGTRDEAMSRVRDIVHHEEKTSEEELRYAVRALNKRNKQVLLAIAKGRDPGELAIQMGLKKRAAELLISRCVQKIRKVVDAPGVFSYNNSSNVDFINYVTTGPFKEAIMQELENQYTHGPMWKLTKDQVREIILFRNEHGLSWEAISSRMGASVNTVKKGYMSAPKWN